MHRLAVAMLLVFVSAACASPRPSSAPASQGGSTATTETTNAPPQSAATSSGPAATNPGEPATAKPGAPAAATPGAPAAATPSGPTAASPGAPPAGSEAQGAPKDPFGVLVHEYLYLLFREKPHLADYMGEHAFAGLYWDLSTRHVQRRIAELVELRKRLDAIDRSGLSADERVDADIMSDGIGLELLEMEEIRQWHWDPRLIDPFTYFDPREIVADRLSSLVHATWGTEAERREALIGQLRAVPRIIESRERVLSVDKVSKVHLDQAVKENLGRIAFFENELPPYTKGNAAAEESRVDALFALTNYEKFLEKILPERVGADWRLGAELYRKKFPLALQTDLKPEELVRLARQDFDAARAELYAVARKLAGELFPRQPVPPEGAAPAEQAKLIGRVRDALSKDHPAPDALVRVSAAQIDRLRALVQAKGIIELPPADTLSVEPEPEYKRGAAGAEYLSPGALDRSAPFHGTYYVDPVDPTWPKEKVESYMRANNNYEIALTAAHEAIPGHHTQAWWARRDPSILRATLWSGPFAEGWAVYAEGLLVKLGLGDAKNDRYRFFDLRGRMIVAANAILDVGLQGGTMTDEEALRFMIEDGFQEPAQAEKKLLRAKLDSTQLCQYFLGWAEIERLEHDVRQKGGFNQGRFDEALLSHATIAVKHLRQYVLGR